MPDMRKSKQDIRGLLDQLDAQAAHSDVVRGRRSERFPYRVEAQLFEVRESDGSWRNFEARTRNIGKHGVGLIVGRFMYPRSLCRIGLINTHQQRVIVPGKVARCRYLSNSGSIYEVGVKFDDAINVEAFQRYAAELNILLLHADAIIRDVVPYLLKSTNASVTAVSTLEQAAERVRWTAFDMLLVDLDTPHVNVLSFLKTLRDEGSAALFVVMTARSGAELLESVQAIDGLSVLPKPITRESLTRAIFAARQVSNVSLVNDPGMRPYVDAFIAGLAKKLFEVEKCIATANWTDVERWACSLEGEAGTFGFPRLAEAACRLEKLVRASAGPDRVRECFIQLRQTCATARSGWANDRR